MSATAALSAAAVADLAAQRLGTFVALTAALAIVTGVLALARRPAAARLPGQLHLRAGAQGVHRRARADDHHRPGPEAVRGARRERRLLRAAVGRSSAPRRHPRADARRRRRLAGRSCSGCGASRPSSRRRSWSCCSASPPSHVLHLDDHGVEIVGHIDGGLPVVRPARRRRPATTSTLAPAAVGVMLVGFAEGLGAAKTYAAQRPLRDRRQPRADRARRREPRLRACRPGWSSTAACRRPRSTASAGRTVAALRPHRRGADRRHAAVPDRPVREPARGDARRRRDRRGDRARGHPRAASAVPIAHRAARPRSTAVAARPDFIAASRRCSAC